MNDSERHMITDRVLDHCIFSNRPVYITPKDNDGRKVSFYVEEIMEDYFVADMTAENVRKVKQEDLKGRELLVTTGHRNQAFVFDSQLVDVFNVENGEEGQNRTHFFFKKPPTGMLRNQRQDPRFLLEPYAPYLKAELKISSQMGDFTFETRHLVDMSQNLLALFLDRSQGLVLPGDKVVSLALFHQNAVVLETEGSVLRTDMKRISDQMKDSYFIVVRMGRAEGSLPPLTRTQEGPRLEGLKAFVDGDHSILRGYGFSGQVQDLSTSRMSFTVDGPETPLIPGLVLNEIYIHIPPGDLHLKACLKVTHCAPAPEEGKTSVSGEFLGMSIDLIKAVNRLRDRAMDSRLTEAKREDFDQLLEFFFESGFIYSGKRKQLQKYAASVRQTNMTLLQSGDALMKKVLFKENREIKGHISALRVFDRTWLVQHLTTHHATGTATSKAILNSIINFFLDSSANRKVGTSYVTCYYRPGNLYPEVLFGETQRTIANPDICGMADLEFCVSGSADPGAGNEEGVDPAVACAEAQAADLVRLERLLIDQGRYFLIRAEGLTAEGLTQLAVSAEYEKLGLYRRRRVFAARRAGEEDGVYAVCNYASPGCNLSELTNSFRLYYPAGRTEPDKDVVNRLVKHVLASYRSSEMPSPVLLLEEGQPLPENFKKIRAYRYWYFDAAYCPLFKEAAESNIVHIKEILKRLKAENPGLKDPSYEHA